MMINIFGWVARRRVAVLVVSLVVAVILQVLRRTVGDGHSLRLNLAIGVLPLIPFVVGMAIAVRVFHPAELIARPEVPAFDVPANPAAVLGAASYTFFAVFALGGAFHGLVTGMDVVLASPLVVVVGGQLAAFWWAALGRCGVRLTPDGIVDRQVHGRLFVPWDALTTPDPAHPRDPHQVTLRIGRPDMVRKRGFRSGGRTVLPATGVSAELVSRAINEYANRPEARSAIGSEVALTHLQMIPQV
ncbi:hypothetical protein [Actinoplanes awajinensis]|uniref:PH domain-containing protein n=1 Tax=Actinoplanes awajinensis subsp. mycoplanecinus TaxID=135947 RepID=A0A117MQ72_9ACTN|nr:hypothetical protein [Actinoplanes awajinensis]KUL29739.1 hypothetical protein ADL15_26920 [Actinoplanes awajinensis subsp. mycoplanecinus]